MNFDTWDLVLLAVVTIDATVLAYISNARVKAALLALPIPFAFAVLAVAKPIEVTHAMGPIVLLIYTHAVRIFHQSLRINIIAAIVLSAMLYISIGWIAGRFVPESSLTFWSFCALNLLLGGVLHLRRDHHVEPPYRTQLPLWVKLPIIMAVVVGLLMLKKYLAGFVATFPMVGVIAAYEMRRSLRTTCQAIPLTMLLLTPMLMCCRLAYPHLGMIGALIAAWGTVILIAPLLLRKYLTSAPAVEIQPSCG